MLRILLALAVLISFTLCVRHQYQKVIKEVTKPTTAPSAFFKTAETRRHKCLLCGGSGKAPSFYLGTGKPAAQSSKPCPTCNGTGWVEDAFFPRK